MSMPDSAHNVLVFLQESARRVADRPALIMPPRYAGGGSQITFGELWEAVDDEYEKIAESTTS